MRRFNVQTDAFTTQPCRSFNSVIKISAFSFVELTTFGAECRLPHILVQTAAPCSAVGVRQLTYL